MSRATSSQPRASVQKVRQINRSAILRALYFNAPTSRLELAQLAQLSPATISNLLNELLDEGIVIEAGSEDSDGGRPRVLLSVNPRYGYLLGADVGETQVSVELFDLQLRPLRQLCEPIDPDETLPEQIVGHIVNGVERLLGEAGLVRGEIIGLGIGVPGLVDPTEGVSIFAPNWGWHHVPLLAPLESLGISVFLDNGAKAMTLAEARFGAGRGAQSVAVLLIGTGVGAGIFANGALYRGATNSAGEWGHTTLQLDGRPCRCGSMGCVEAYLGAPALLRRLEELAPDHPALEIGDQMEGVARLIAAARAGEPAARTVLDETTHFLGAGIANLINLVNPECIVVGGWAGMLLGEELLPELRPVIERYALAQPFSRTSLRLSRFSHDAVSRGAASLVLEDFLTTPTNREPGVLRSGPVIGSVEVL